MARIGINPTRNKFSDYRPARVTLVVLTYIPHLEGYFKQKFEILQLTISSLVANTAVPYDLLVFDNGSCGQVVDYLSRLRAAGTIDYLLLSHRNLGKIGAFRLLFNAAPGEIIAYADDDILFYPGWLEAHLEIMETFPQVGMVSGVPVRDAASRASKSLQGYISQDVPGLVVTQGRCVPDEWEVDWALSVGRDPQGHLHATRNEQDLVLTLDGVEAFGSASHFQFVAPKHVVQAALPDEWSGKLMGHMNELDEAIDALGYLRLATLARYTRHIGNVISPSMAEELQTLGMQPIQPLARPASRWRWLRRIPLLGRVLRKLYDQLFRILQEDV